MVSETETDHLCFKEPLEQGLALYSINHSKSNTGKKRSLVPDKEEIILINKVFR